MPALSPEAMAERREALLAAAMACFARNGFRATSMRDICKQAGVSIGGLYCHFRSKEEIVLAIAAQPRTGFDTTYAQARNAVEKGRPSHTVACDVVRTLMQFTDGEEGRERLHGDIAVMGDAVSMPAIREILAATDRRHIDGFAGLLASDTKPKDAKALAQVLVATLYGLMVLSAFHDDFDREACIDALERLLAKNAAKGVGS